MQQKIPPPTCCFGHFPRFDPPCDAVTSPPPPFMPPRCLSPPPPPLLKVNLSLPPLPLSVFGLAPAPVNFYSSCAKAPTAQEVDWEGSRGTEGGEKKGGRSRHEIASNTLSTLLSKGTAGKTLGRRISPSLPLSTLFSFIPQKRERNRPTLSPFNFAIPPPPLNQTKAAVLLHQKIIQDPECYHVFALRRRGIRGRLETSCTMRMGRWQGQIISNMLLSLPERSPSTSTIPSPSHQPTQFRPLLLRLLRRPRRCVGGRGELGEVDLSE